MSGCCRSEVFPSEGHRLDLLEMSLAKCNIKSCREREKQGGKALWSSHLPREQQGPVLFLASSVLGHYLP